MSVVEFPVQRGAVADVISGLSAAFKAKQIKAIAVLTIEHGGDEQPTIRVRHGWDADTIRTYDLLALASGLEHSKLAIHDILDT